MNTIKCLNVDDVYLMKLPQGTFLVDGEVVTVGYGGLEIQCVSNEIIPISQTRIKTHYENAEGVKMTPERYEAELDEVRERGKYDDDFGWDFDADEDLIIHRRLMREWSACYRDAIQYGDPIPIESKPITMDTGSEYIKPVLGFKENRNGVYIYNKAGFCMDKMRSLFTDLGMTFGGNLNHESTSGKKVWGNSDHSHMRYVTAFGTYIFSEKYSGSSYGELNSLKAEMKHNGEEIERIIRSKYALHFNGASIDSEKVLSEMKTLVRVMYEIEPKQKSSLKMSNAIGMINKIIKNCEEDLSA